jgi:hypothetical protein
MIEQAAVQRLYSKANLIQQEYKLNKGDWQETFFQQLAKNFGFKVNAEAFITLAKSLPLRIVRKNSNELLQIEALLFGAAGFLELKKGDSYYISLQKEFNYLASKYDLNAKKMHKAQWKFLRLRPANFPTLRLAQLSGILFQSTTLFNRIIETDDLKSIRKIFTVPPSPYWYTHYSFGKESKRDHGLIGEESVDNILINTVVPVLAAYAQEKGDETFFNRALEFLQQIKGESNSIIKMWQSLNVKAVNAFDSQGLIEQKNSNCKKRNCLNCTVGNYLLKPV